MYACSCNSLIDLFGLSTLATGKENKTRSLALSIESSIKKCWNGLPRQQKQKITFELPLHSAKGNRQGIIA
jgi:hypothetical protein